MFKQIQILLRIFPFSHLLRKINFLSISVLLSKIVTLWRKREVLCEFPQKCFKTTEKHSLAVCGSLWGEKQFLLIFVPFYWFDQKQMFKQIQIFLRIFQFSNMLRKKNFLCISVILSEIVTFLTEKKSSLWFFPKNAKITEKHSLAVCGSLSEEKKLLLIFVPSYWFDQKQLFKQIQIFFRIYHLSNMLRKTNFLTISLLLSEICMRLILGRKTIFVNISPLLLVWLKTVV